MCSVLDPPAEFDDYQIVKPLGSGAMGQVYLALDTVLARPIAIKFLAASPDPQARQRFLMEARAAARIQHPNVVSIYRVGELGDRPYIVSELVRGASLAEAQRPMAWANALDIGLQLARGLAAAHRRGVVHCDVKPGNAMLTEDGTIKLVDFGLAQVGEHGPGTMVGTPDYMAPELWSGDPPTRRSDVYALGAVLYELLAGATPFAGTDVHTLGEVVRATAAPALATEPRLASIIARCLDRDPAQRYASGDDLREALERLAAARTAIARADENPYRGLRPFEASHRALFFGRSLEVGAVVERLRTETVVVIAGDSGVGKSSLCRAGVLPAIVDGGLGGGRTWRALTIVPGRHPLAALAQALDDATLTERVLADPDLLARELHRHAGDDGLVLFVDQMEELVTVGDPTEVAAFDAALARISAGVAGVKLVTTVRADFLPRMIALPQFGEELSHVLYFVRPLPPERVRDVITGPATATNVAFEDDALVTALVDATAQAGSGGLPLLSFALAELWEAHDRERGMITHAELAAMGGVAGALARHADAVIAAVRPDDRVHVRRALLRLVTSEGTRVRRSEAELAVSPATRPALAALVKGRLLVAHDGETGPVYELAHEVLVRGWTTLRDWLDADADDRARREKLAAAAADWDRADRRPDLLWQGLRLIEARALEADSLTPLEREFVAASSRHASKRRWLRRSALFAIIAASIAAYVVHGAVVARRLADAVDAELATARADLDRARGTTRQRTALATSAFAGFDDGARDAAEAAWAQALLAGDSAAKQLRGVARRIEGALAMDPTRDDVRAMLGDVLLERAVLADAVHDANTRDEMLARLPSYDADGSRRARWSAPGELVVHASTGATIRVDDRVVGIGSAALELAPGLHAIVVATPGRPELREPVFVAAHDHLTRELAAPSVPPGYVYVPAGEFQFGSAQDEDSRQSFLTTAPLHVRSTAAYLIARTEVTFGDWLTFVEAQPADRQAQLLPAVASKIDGGMALARDGSSWKLTLQPNHHAYSARWGEPIAYAGRKDHATQDWRYMPVLGITALDAEAYVRWLDRSGAVPGARLCTELEWERAARGPDGRTTPTGAPLAASDANIDITYNRDQIGPDEVGTHPQSESPYGLFDTAGNAFEWTKQVPDRGYVLRGGTYYHDRKTADLTNRNETTPSLRDATAGLRVCATPH